MAVADHQAVALVIALLGERGHIGIDLSVQGGGQHPPCTLGHQFVQRGGQLRVRGRLNMYSQHWRSFLAGVPPPASPCFVQRGRYVAPSVRWCIHKFWLYLVGMAPTADGAGYWLIAADRGVFSFGDATFYGSMGSAPTPDPAEKVVSSRSGHGYWIVDQTGTSWAFGDAGAVPPTLGLMFEGG